MSMKTLFCINLIFFISYSFLKYFFRPHEVCTSKCFERSTKTECCILSFPHFHSLTHWCGLYWKKIMLYYYVTLSLSKIFFSLILFHISLLFRYSLTHLFMIFMLTTVRRRMNDLDCWWKLKKKCTNKVVLCAIQILWEM